MKFLALISLAISLTICAVPTKDVLEMVKPFIPQNPIIIEAGSHQGEDTVLISAFWPEGKLYTFEPLPHLFTMVCEKTVEHNNVTRFQLALSDHVGTAQLYVCVNNPGASSLLAPTACVSTFLKHAKTPLTVSCMTLDAWAAQQGVDHIDFMWLDMEGHELAMLKASPEIFKTVKAVYTEVNQQQFRVGTPLYEEVVAWFAEQGFREEWKFLTPNWQGDVLFVRN